MDERLYRLNSLVFATAIVAACSETITAPAPGLRVVSGGTITDTARALPLQELVIELRNASSQPEPGVGVGVQISDTVCAASGTGLRADNAAVFRDSATETTDAAGRLRVAFRFGGRAGLCKVQITVPERQLRDSTQLAILPGTPVRLYVTPSDTALLVNGSYSLRPVVSDASGNAVAASINCASRSPAATVNSGNLVSGRSIARVVVSCSSGRLADSAFVSIVPDGVLAAFFQGGLPGAEAGILLTRTDGSQMLVLASSAGPSQYGAWPTWSPSGEQLAFVSDTKLYTVDLSGTVREIVGQINAPAGGGYSFVGIDGAVPPQYSWDGDWIYFTAFSGGGQRAIWRATSNGDSVMQTGEGLDWGLEGWPSPQAQGGLLAYQTNRMTNSPIDFTIRLIGMDDRVVRPLDVPGLSPRWAPVGGRLAYVDRDGFLHTMRPDATDDRPVPGPTSAQVGFSWSPDAEWLATAEWSWIAGREILKLVRVSTGEQLPLAFPGPSGAQLTHPAWRPR